MITTILTLLGAILAIEIAATAALYFAIGRLQRLLTHAEQLQAVGATLLALVPGKSAPRTTAPADIQPRRWWQKLRDAMATVPDAEPQLHYQLGPDPTLPAPAPAPEPQPSTTTLIDDVELAHAYAFIEDDVHTWRAQLDATMAGGDQR